MPLSAKEKAELDELEKRFGKSTASENLEEDESEELARLEAKFGKKKAPEMQGGSPLRIATEEGLTFGARPAVAGIGGAIGGALAKLQSPREMGLLQRLKEAGTAASEGFSEERTLAQQEQKQAAEELGPIASTGIALGTGLLTAPLTPIRTVSGGIKLGAGLGAARAAGEAEDLTDAAGMIAGSAALAGGAGALGKHLNQRSIIQKMKAAGEDISPEKLAKLPPEILKEIERGLPLEKVNASDIKKAAESFGVKATPGMLSKDLVLGGMESSLSQAPTLAGESVRKQVNPIREAIQQRATGLLDEGIPTTQIAEVGGDIQKGMASKISERLAPIKAMYGDLESHMTNIPLTEKGKLAISKNVLKSDAAQVAPGIAGKYSDLISNAKNLNQIKLIRSDAISVVQNPAASATEKAIASDVIEKLNSLTERQATRAAIEVSGGRSGKVLAKGLLQTRKAANTQYKSLMNDLEFISERAGLGSSAKYGPDNFIKSLTDKYSAEELPRKLFDLKDQRLLQSFKTQFPEQFESARKLRLGEILEKSTVKGEINPSNFLKQVRGLSKESIESLFGEGKEETIKNIQTLINAFPEKMGPSGTPQGVEFSKYIDAIMSPKQETKDALRLAAYKRRAGLLGKKPAALSPKAFTSGHQAFFSRKKED